MAKVLRHHRVRAIPNPGETCGQTRGRILATTQDVDLQLLLRMRDADQVRLLCERAWVKMYDMHVDLIYKLPSKNHINEDFSLLNWIWSNLSSYIEPSRSIQYYLSLERPMKVSAGFPIIFPQFKYTCTFPFCFYEAGPGEVGPETRGVLQSNVLLRS